MNIAWLTDLHLNFVMRSDVEDLCAEIRSTCAEAILITGDIATSENLCRYLDYLADDLKIPVYFVLGNHDYFKVDLSHHPDSAGGQLPTLFFKM